MVRLNIRQNYRRQTFHNKIKQIDILSFFNRLLKRFIYFIKYNISLFGCIKVLMVLNVNFKKGDGEENLIYSNPYFSTYYTSFNTPKYITKKLRQMFKQILCSFDCYCVNGSGWQLNFINFLEIKAVRISQSISGSGV